MASMAAHASLEPMSWGFPTLIHNSSLTNFSNSFAWANDDEFTGISFPTAGISDFGISSFPTITQTTSKSQLMSSFSFSHQEDNMMFTYPWESVGFSPVPSMGFL